ELARNGHRAAQGGPSMAGWNFVRGNALPWSDISSLFVPGVPALSFSENFGYVGILAALLALSAVGFAVVQKRPNAEFVFSLVLALFGLLYAFATPLSQYFYFSVPGLSQMGGVGRAFLLWSLGIALLAGFGLDALRRLPKMKQNSVVLSGIVILLVSGELFLSSWNLQPTAPRAAIYPPTPLTTWLKENTKDGSRILFVTPRKTWGASEDFGNSGRTHPAGVLPPNGATVYGLNDVNGYDSLAPLAYRKFVVEGEGADVSPLRNGNMILLENADSISLDALGVRYVVSEQPLDATSVELVKQFDDVRVYERAPTDLPQMSGADFSPGWRDSKYQPQSFRFGAFISLCALMFAASALAARKAKA
ncbi:MAG TPA: hypothetical protein VF719_03780, partial [Abditibacteriaceae bacterium]